MKTGFLFLISLNSVLLAGDAAVSRMLDDKLTVAQRNDACYELRGVKSPEVIAAMARALESPKVRTCAARSLREAGATGELKNALAESDPELRAVAARELGALARPELMELLAKTAHDPNLLVASNAFAGLSYYQDRSVLPHLLDLAERGGLVGAMALSRAVQFHDPSVLQVARTLLASKDVALRLGALRAIGDLGNETDLPALRPLAAKSEKVLPRGRGFGLVPALDLSRAAQNAIYQIENRK